MRSNNPFGAGSPQGVQVTDYDTPQAYGQAYGQYPQTGVQAMGGKLKNVEYEDPEPQRTRTRPRRTKIDDDDDDDEGTNYCASLCNCFPLRLLCFAGGALLIVCSVLDTLFNRDSMLQFFLRVYLIFFGIVIMIIESPSWSCSRYFQLKIFFWYRILSRMWGRAWFYLFATLLCFGEFDKENSAEFTIFAGFYFFIISILSFVFSKLAANKYNRMFVYIAAGSEGDELIGRLEYKFDELARVTEDGEEGHLGAQEIIKLANEAGRTLSNGQRHAIQTYLDDTCNGFVTKDDFIGQFLRLTVEKQRFL